MLNHNIQHPRSERHLNWAVVGASGFVGNGIIEALREVGTTVICTIKSPRLLCSKLADSEFILESLLSDNEVTDAVDYLAASLAGVDVVVNAAGVAAPDATESDILYGANSLLPVVIAEAAKRAGVNKFLHISSAAVQGSKEILDETSFVEPFSAYSHSKALAEQALAHWEQRRIKRHTNQLEIVIIRATSVQGAGRRTTSTLNRVACSSLASVARPGNQPSVVSSVTGLSKFVVTVGSSAEVMPQILIQPWEGATVRDIMMLSGDGRRPLVLPRLIARGAVNSLKALGLLLPSVRGLARRLEVMWFGQKQVSGWGVDSGLVRAIDQPTDMLRRALTRQ